MHVLCGQTHGNTWQQPGDALLLPHAHECASTEGTAEVQAADPRPQAHQPPAMQHSCCHEAPRPEALCTPRLARGACRQTPLLPLLLLTHLGRSQTRMPATRSPAVRPLRFPASHLGHLLQLDAALEALEDWGGWWHCPSIHCGLGESPRGTPFSLPFIYIEFRL
jgi:hypothetical protein